MLCRRPVRRGNIVDARGGGRHVGVFNDGGGRVGGAAVGVRGRDGRPAAAASAVGSSGGGAPAAHRDLCGCERVRFLLLFFCLGVVFVYEGGGRICRMRRWWRRCGRSSGGRTTAGVVTGRRDHLWPVAGLLWPAVTTHAQ